MEFSEQKRRHLRNLIDNLGEVYTLFHDELLTDISIPCGSHGSAFVTRFAKGQEKTKVRLSYDKRMSIINDICSLLDVRIDKQEYPVLEGVIPYMFKNLKREDGSHVLDSRKEINFDEMEPMTIRVQAIIPPWADEPGLYFRKAMDIDIFLEDYVDAKRMTKEQFNHLESLIKRRKNLIVAGSTGSGKTFLVNAIINKMIDFTPKDHFYIVQDAPELKCHAECVSPVVVPREKAPEAFLIAMRILPKRIIFGEIREGHVANGMLESWNSGHTGNVSTIHANSAKDAIISLETKMRRVSEGKEIIDVRSSVDAFIFIRNKEGFGPFIEEIYETKKEV